MPSPSSRAADLRALLPGMDMFTKCCGPDGSCQEDDAPSCDTPLALRHGGREELLSTDRVLWHSEMGAECYFPLFAVPATEVESLGHMAPHEEMYSALALEERRPGGCQVIFVSHQWTSFGKPDHSNMQFETLSTFLTDGNLQSTLATASDDFEWRCAEQTNVKRVLSDVNIGESLVWLDYWSIPQGRANSHQQMLAIKSIPAYSTSAAIMLVLAPPVEHADCPGLCDFDSWSRRGWCRLEELTFCLTAYGNGESPFVYILDEQGGKPRRETIALPQRLRNPSTAVLRGNFTCCARGHVGTDGAVMPCDRDRLAKVISKVDDHMTASSLKNQDLPTWRRLRSTRWMRLSEAPQRSSASQLLSDLLITNMTERLEGDMYALHYAVYANDPTAVTQLVALRADVRCCDGDGLTPLHLAAASDLLPVATALLDVGADANFRHLNGTTGIAPVHSAVFSSGTEVLTMLLERRADVSVRASECSVSAPVRGMNPLHFAIFTGKDQQVVNILLRAKADPEERVGEGGPHAGKSPMQLARLRGRKSLVFAAAGSKISL